MELLVFYKVIKWLFLQWNKLRSTTQDSFLVSGNLFSGFVDLNNAFIPNSDQAFPKISYPDSTVFVRSVSRVIYIKKI